MKRLALAFILMLTATAQSQETQQQFSTFTAAWWNVEDLFDTRDDPKTNDDEFTPEGDRHWTRRRLNKKINGIYKTLAMMDLPDVVGLGEVENKYVLRELCQGTPLAQVPYRYVHYDSPDRRGIDVALIYRTDRFTVTASRTVNVSDTASKASLPAIFLSSKVLPPLATVSASWSTTGLPSAAARRPTPVGCR